MINRTIETCFKPTYQGHSRAWTERPARSQPEWPWCWLGSHDATDDNEIISRFMSSCWADRKPSKNLVTMPGILLSSWSPIIDGVSSPLTQNCHENKPVANQCCHPRQHIERKLHYSDCQWNGLSTTKTYLNQFFNKQTPSRRHDC